jgi:hypothetical protein
MSNNKEDKGKPPIAGAKNQRQPGLICLADVEPRSVNWLWKNRIPAGRMTLLGGPPDVGKSFFICDMAARISMGEPWPDGAECEQGSVILLSAEDDPHDTIRPRLDAHGADANKVQLLSHTVVTKPNGEVLEVPISLADSDTLEASIQRVGDCRLLVVDPIGSFLGSKTDSYRDNEVRSALAPILKLAEKYAVALVVIAHTRKSSANVADDLALGSRAFTALPRATWYMFKDLGNEQRKLLLPGKNNLASTQSGLAFTIMGEPAAIHWEPECVEMSANDFLAEFNTTTFKAPRMDEAKEWLQTLLQEGPLEGNEVKAKATDEGIALRTLERAKSVLEVETKPDGFRGPWKWHLPDSPSLRQESAESAND